MDNEQILKTPEVARRLGIAEATLRKYADLGLIPMHRNPTNGQRIFKTRDIERIIANCVVPGDTEV